MTENVAYLRDDDWYCPHLKTISGKEVSLYDDLYWERYMSQCLREVLELAFDDFLEAGDLTYDSNGSEEHRDLIAEFCTQLETQDGPRAAVARDMLEKGIDIATFDW